MITCHNCGRGMKEDDNFCPYCGASAAWRAAGQAALSNERNDDTEKITPPARTGWDSVEQGKKGTGLGWISLVRSFLWFVLILGLVVVTGILSDENSQGAALLWFVEVILLFLMAAGGMIALNNATNLIRIANNTEALTELLKELCDKNRKNGQ